MLSIEKLRRRSLSMYFNFEKVLSTSAKILTLEEHFKATFTIKRTLVAITSKYTVLVEVIEKDDILSKNGKSERNENDIGIRRVLKEN